MLLRYSIATNEVDSLLKEFRKKEGDKGSKDEEGGQLLWKKRSVLFETSKRTTLRISDHKFIVRIGRDPLMGNKEEMEAKVSSRAKVCVTLSEVGSATSNILVRTSNCNIV